MKEFLILIRENLEVARNMTAQEMQEDIEKHIKWVEKLTAKGHYKSGNPLDTQGHCIEGNQKIVTDGPFIESKEGIGGYYFLLAESLEQATEIAKGCPALEAGSTLEVREVITV